MHRSARASTRDRPRARRARANTPAIEALRAQPRAGRIRASRDRATAPPRANDAANDARCPRRHRERLLLGVRTLVGMFAWLEKTDVERDIRVLVFSALETRV